MPPLPRVRGFGRPCDVEQPGLAVLLDEVTDQGHGASLVVGVDDVGMGFVG